MVTKALPFKNEFSGYFIDGHIQAYHKEFWKEDCPSLFSESAVAFVAFSGSEIRAIHSAFKEPLPSAASKGFELAKFVSLLALPLILIKLVQGIVDPSSCEPNQFSVDTLLDLTINLTSLGDCFVATGEALSAASSSFKAWGPWLTILGNICGFLGVVTIAAELKGFFDDEKMIDKINLLEKRAENTPQELAMLSAVKTRIRWKELNRAMTIVATAVGIVGLCLLIWCPPLAVLAWSLYAVSTGFMLVQLIMEGVIDKLFYQELDRI